MKAATIHEIKHELASLPPKQLLELALRLAKFKKENKELLSYLLFEAHDEHNYVESAKAEIDEGFSSLPLNNLYLMKKGLRKILKNISRYCRFTLSRQTEAELLIHFCKSLKGTGVNIKHSIALSKIYDQQLKKARTAIAALHEDLHYDYTKKLAEIS
ncbi:hypothetical protein EXU57_05895 [Segetibacter sp. 3557_3]|uniref:hypothetical protein n=1 Tax=Segetibacter sp. 3557_3 TaxID=2547429 RepID=UPI001058B7A4|nr:hypothetical protein [Segetibacter sp. 3557_3]TDH27993.1 hypothetical protein EXU57_05895 [Segetibacter sp. 3557_3]